MEISRIPLFDFGIKNIRKIILSRSHKSFRPPDFPLDLEPQIMKPQDYFDGPWAFLPKSEKHIIYVALWDAAVIRYLIHRELKT